MINEKKGARIESFVDYHETEVKTDEQIRIEKMNLIKERLKSGFYFEEEFTVKLVDKLFKSMGL